MTSHRNFDTQGSLTHDRANDQSNQDVVTVKNQKEWSRRDPANFGLRERVERLLAMQENLRRLADQTHERILNTVREMPLEQATRALDEAARQQALLLLQMHRGLGGGCDPTKALLTNDELQALMDLAYAHKQSAPEVE